MSFLSKWMLMLSLAVSVRSLAVEIAFDTNDVSVLFALQNDKPNPRINLLTDSLLPAEIFQQILTFEMKVKDLEHLPYLDSAYLKDMQSWFVTAFRVDPCGEVFSSQSLWDVASQENILQVTRMHGCQPRLRLVIQPFNGFGHPLPTALHLMFKLSDPQLQSLLSKLSELKIKLETEENLITTNQPLGIHPGLLSENGQTQSKTAEGFRQILLSFFPELLPSMEILTMNVQSDFNHWRLVGGLVSKGQWTRLVTNFSKKLSEISIAPPILGLEIFTCDLNPICLFQPTTDPDHLPTEGRYLTYLFRDLLDMKQLQVPGFRTRPVQQAAEEIDRVDQTHFFNTNCMSCHQSSNFRDYKQLHSDQKLPDGITPFVAKKYLSPKVNTVINFGYQGLFPRISTRTAAESAIAADRLNQMRGLRNPAKTRPLQEFWKCLTSQPNWNQCLTE